MANRIKIKKGLQIPLLGKPEEVFRGEITSEYLQVCPEDFQGHSLSISDVVEIVNGENAGFYFCDSIGFQPVKFEPEQTQKLDTRTMRVVLVEPGKRYRRQSAAAAAGLLTAVKILTYKPAAVLSFIRQP